MPGSYKELFENNEVVVRKLKRDCEAILICISRQNQAEYSRKSVDKGDNLISDLRDAQSKKDEILVWMLPETLDNEFQA